jgi:hypothetical protein
MKTYYLGAIQAKPTVRIRDFVFLNDDGNMETVSCAC